MIVFRALSHGPEPAVCKGGGGVGGSGPGGGGGRGEGGGGS